MKQILLAAFLAGVACTSFAQPTLTPEEKNVFLTIANQDIEAMRNGEESIFFPMNGKHYASIVPIQALESIYAKGIDKANSIFKNQWVVLEGEVLNVSSGDLPKTLSVSFKTQRPNMDVVANLIEGQTLANVSNPLQEGKEARLVCKSLGKIEHQLRFQECQELSYFADQTQARINRLIGTFLNGTTGDEHVDKLIAHVVVLTSLMDEEQLALCKDPIGVSQALKKVMVKYNRRSAQNPKAVARLKELGL